MSNGIPKLSIVIPHLKGVKILDDCLGSVFDSTYQDIEVLLIDNASEDGSREMLCEKYPQVKQIRLETNRGYAGGCNVGIRQSEADYILLLNDDTVLAPDAIAALVNTLESNPEIAGAQPKLLNIQDRCTFDYSGACGGLIDIFGYPFAFGRTFMSLEMDEGQYDSKSYIFWACGTCAIFRRTTLLEVGLLDEDFFAHMEEIDLAWRLQIAGYSLVRTPEAKIYHYSGHTLPNTQRQKMYLNHRNSIACLVKNYTLSRLVWILPLRLLLEWGIIVVSFLRGDFRRGSAALNVQIILPRLIYQAWLKRGDIKKRRRVSDKQVMRKMYKGSVVFQHFLLKKSKALQILHDNKI